MKTEQCVELLPAVASFSLSYLLDPVLSKNDFLKNHSRTPLYVK